MSRIAPKGKVRRNSNRPSVWPLGAVIRTFCDELEQPGQPARVEHRSAMVGVRDFAVLTQQLQLEFQRVAAGKRIVASADVAPGLFFSFSADWATFGATEPGEAVYRIPLSLMP